MMISLVCCAPIGGCCGSSECGKSEEVVDDIIERPKRIKWLELAKLIYAPFIN